MSKSNVHLTLERLVDRLLQSPGYGEHQARYWLDAVRYGDTHGLHLDNVSPIARLPYMTELNIGHSIVARAIFIGLKEAVNEMRRAIQSA